jgi:uncharacterized protein HemX
MLGERNQVKKVIPREEGSIHCPRPDFPTNRRPLMPTFLSFPKNFVRMARQHKATAVAWVAALLSLGIAVTGISVFALRAERARDREQEQQELAEENAAEARAAIAAEQNQRERAEQQRKLAEEKTAAAEASAQKVRLFRRICG